MIKLFIIIGALFTVGVQANGPTLEGTIKVYPSPPVTEGQKPVNPNPTTNCCGVVPLRDKKDNCCYKPTNKRSVR